ncbi:uncharacterized protein LOC113245741 isoform X1 [Ursus arctos]|uniref:uncharacterized protein LOC113245741 isoform X1 n=1 Tax=Ursus arctos TaxID=9644 RepID=UPI001CF815A9|nr:uncharacterized protein LOC113245741 isoform X1 [Ursus arctos]
MHRGNAEEGPPAAVTEHGAVRGRPCGRPWKMTLGGGAAPLWRMGAASWGAGWRVSRRAAKRSALAGLADARRRLPRRLRSLCPRRAATQTGPRPAPAGVQDGPEGGSRVLSLRGAPRQAVQTFSPTFPREHPPCRPCGREVSKVKKTFMTVYQAVPICECCSFPLLLISAFILLWPEKTLYDFYLLKTTETYHVVSTYGPSRKLSRVRVRSTHVGLSLGTCSLCLLHLAGCLGTLKISAHCLLASTFSDERSPHFFEGPL